MHSKTFLNSGISEKDDCSKRRSILITNYISLFLLLALFATFIARRVIYSHVTSTDLKGSYLLIGAIFMSIPVLLNRLKFTTWSRILLCILPVIFLWFVYIAEMSTTRFLELSMYDGLRIHLLAMSIIPYLIFGRDMKLMLILGIIPTLISITFADSIYSWFGLAISQKGIESIDYEIMQLRTMVTYFLIGGGSFTFHSIIMRNDKLNESIQAELRWKSKKILAQNTQLNKSQIKLQDLNCQLEQLVQLKGKHLKLQNEKLHYYANLNAHDVRGPLARLVGLMHLRKVDILINQSELLEKIEDEVTELNHVINSMSNQLNVEGLYYNLDIDRADKKR